MIELVGCCLWDVVSHNHKVLDGNGEEISLGSFRVAGEAIADFAMQHSPDSPGWNYMDFYLGTRWPRPPADVAPTYQAIYEVIFTRMRAAGFAWQYHAPEAQVMQVGEPDTGVSSAVAALQRALDEAYTKAQGTSDDPHRYSRRTGPFTDVSSRSGSRAHSERARILASAPEIGPDASSVQDPSLRSG